MSSERQSRTEMMRTAAHAFNAGHSAQALFLVLYVHERLMYRLVRAEERQARSLARIVRLLEPPALGQINLTATVTDKEGNPVAESQAVTLDPVVNDVQFNTAPSVPAPAGGFSWLSSSPAVVLEVAADGLSAKGRCNATMPTAVTTISCSATGFESNSQQVIFQAGQATGQINLSATLIAKGA